MFNNDPKIKDVLKNASPEEIKNGIVEKTLRRIHPDIRSKLDEVKRNIIMEYRFSNLIFLCLFKSYDLFC